MAEDENVDTSTVEGTSEVADTPSQETNVNQSSEAQDSAKKQDTQATESEENVNWEERAKYFQAEKDRLQQQIKDFGKTEIDRARQQDYQKFQEEQKQRLNVGTYMTQYKNPDGTPDVAGGLNAWMQAREDNINQRVQGMIGPVSNQTQYLQWSLSRMLKKIDPEGYKEQMNLEKKIKGLYDEMPALRTVPNSITLAEQIILSKASKKDRDTLVKDAIKQGKKSAQQEQGVSISPSKAPTKKQLSAAETWHQQIIESGRQKTVL